MFESCKHKQNSHTKSQKTDFQFFTNKICFTALPKKRKPVLFRIPLPTHFCTIRSFQQAPIPSVIILYGLQGKSRLPLIRFRIISGSISVLPGARKAPRFFYLDFNGIFGIGILMGLVDWDDWIGFQVPRFAGMTELLSE